MPEMSPNRLGSIKSGVVSGLSWRTARTTNLYADSRILERGGRLVAYDQEIPIERATVMVFADEAPRFNWAHRCRYLLFDAESGEVYREVAARFPPFLNEDPPETFHAFHLPIRVDQAELVYPVLPRLRCPIRWRRGERYAVLFSGSSNNRHTNDLEFLYRTLRDIYGFAAGNIYVLNYDGTVSYSGGPKPVVQWPGDNTAYRLPINGEGTKSDLESVLDTLSTRLEAEDLLLIHTNNHGGHNGTESYLCTYSGPSYLASDFAAKLATLPRFKHLIVMMEQCHSGGFNAPILAQSPADLTSVSSACEELRSSIGGPDFDPFARDWISAMAGHSPSGGALASNPDADSSGKVSAQEAHDYADAVKDPYDTPYYSESSAAAGDCHLGQRYSYFWPFYCRILVDALYPFYLRKPIPEFYELLHDKLLPQLEPFEDRLSRLSSVQERELKEVITDLTRRVMD